MKIDIRPLKGVNVWVLCFATVAMAGCQQEFQIGSREVADSTRAALAPDAPSVPVTQPPLIPSQPAPVAPVVVASPTPVVVAPPAPAAPVVVASPTPVVVAPPAPAAPVVVASPTPVVVAPPAPAAPVVVASPTPVVVAPPAPVVPVVVASPTPVVVAPPAPGVVVSPVPAPGKKADIIIVIDKPSCLDGRREAIRAAFEAWLLQFGADLGADFCISVMNSNSGRDGFSESQLLVGCTSPENGGTWDDLSSFQAHLKGLLKKFDAASSVVESLSYSDSPASSSVFSQTDDPREGMIVSRGGTRFEVSDSNGSFTIRNGFARANTAAVWMRMGNEGCGCKRPDKAEHPAEQHSHHDVTVSEAGHHSPDLNDPGQRRRCRVKVHCDNGIGRKIGFEQWIDAYSDVFIRTREVMLIIHNGK